MIPVRQSTAFEIAIGPVLDADGVAVTNCVVGDFKIKKTTGNFAALNGSATLTHVSAGVYDLVLTTSDVDTVGLATVAIDDTTNACASLYLQVMEEAIYDALYAASANAFTGAASASKVSAVVLVDTVTAVTGLTAANLDAAISTRATPAQVNAEVLDVLNVDTFAEVGQETPAATNTLSKMLRYLFKAWRNRSTQTSTTYNLYSDDATTVDQKATTSDDGTTYNRGEVATGP